MTAHAERAHALLSASGASRWINCPPSARVQEHIPDTRSEYADEGTAAHELAEIKLRLELVPLNIHERVELEKMAKEFRSNPFYGPEMENATQEYVEVVSERFMEAVSRSSDAILMLEERLDFSEWVQDGFGTGDVVIISDGVMEICDLKYGKGVPVSAVENPQMKLYALGAWSGFNYLYAIDEVRMTIVQPRLDSVSTYSISVDDLLEWAEKVVKPAADSAFCGEGEFKAGDHCRWCKVRGNCRARAEENMKAISYEFRDPALLSLEEIGSLLYIADQLKAWVKDVEEYAFEQAKNGTKIPQWKLVEGRSSRSISDKDAVKEVLGTADIEPDKYLKPQELLGIGELEKRIGKKRLNELLGEYIVKPPGKPTLVPESDRRPELNSVESEFDGVDFEVASDAD